MKHWQIEQKNDQTWLGINVADSGVNKLSEEVLVELEQTLDSFAQDIPSFLVIHSLKDSGFIAGADVTKFTQITSDSEALNFISKGQSILQKLEDLNCPTLALIDGFCFGGGLELALACDYQVAINNPSTKLGLPEVKLGIHPGFGGTVRSIRNMGSIAALDIMLTGRNLSAKRAKRTKLITDAVPERQKYNAVDYYAKLGKKRSRPTLSKKESILRLPGIKNIFAKILKSKVSKKANIRHYPAPFALIDLWESHIGNEKEMYQAEAKSVAQLINTDSAQNLVRVFNLQTLLKSTAKKSDFTLTHVHVVGAGTMGGDIAAWCALKGFHVTVEDPYPAAFAKTLGRANKLFAKRFRDFKHLSNTAADRLIYDKEGLGRKKADVIIEAIFENLEAKQQLFSDLEAVAKKTAVLATNTSSIPLPEIASVLKKPERLIGIHFFNPVAKMPLVEIIYSENTMKTAITRGSSFCLHIGKLPLLVKSSPGFLVNRVLMPYLLQAVKFYEEGIAIEDIDKSALDFGMPMGPITLADTVGLDICVHAATTLTQTMDLTIPQSIKKMVDNKQLGIKSGKGFYEYNAKKKPVNKGNGQVIPEVQKVLIEMLVNESKKCIEEGLVESADHVDAGIIFGTGFAPFRGGPLHYSDSKTS